MQLDSTSQATTFESLNDATRLTYRDPAGSLFRQGDRFLRLVLPEYVNQALTVLNSPSFTKALQEGTVVPTWKVSEPTSQGLIVEHEKIGFASYPYEWPAEMLFAAASHTLDIAEQFIEDGIGLKDATPYNILFEGNRPVFVDFLSFEKRNPLDPHWNAFAQFVRNFINPLLQKKHFGIDARIPFLSHHDGIEAEELFHLCGPLKRWLPPFLTIATLPTLLSNRNEAKKNANSVYVPKRCKSPEEAQFIYKMVLRSLRKTLDKAKPTHKRSAWSNYETQHPCLSDAQRDRKEEVVAQWLHQIQPKQALDVGCNTGVFSRLLNDHGAEVVAIDSDPTVAGMTFLRAKAENLHILPLCIDIARPSPALGWRNQETQSFLERAEGKFDTVLLLAVLHHLWASSGISVEETSELAAKLSSEFALVEYIHPNDPAFLKIARGRDYSHITQTRFETAFGKHFEILERQIVSSDFRTLFLLRKRK